MLVAKYIYIYISTLQTKHVLNIAFTAENMW